MDGHSCWPKNLQQPLSLSWKSRTSYWTHSLNGFKKTGKQTTQTVFSGRPVQNYMNMLHINMFSWQQQISLYKYSFSDNKCHRNCCLFVSIWACCNPKSSEVDITELFQHYPESHMYELGVRRFEQCWKINKATSYFFFNMFGLQTLSER